MSEICLSTAAIGEVFAQEVEELSGHVAECFDDGRKLFARSLLPFIEEVRRGDRLQGGLALRATDREISLHPYLFRQVCTNGAIMARSFGSHFVEVPDDRSPEEILFQLRQAIRSCGIKEVFVRSIDQVRTSLDEKGDLALNLVPLMARVRHRLDPGFFAQIMERFNRDRDQSRFGLMNAITSLARDTTDPEQRWRLEEFGGAVGAGLAPPEPRGSEGASYESAETAEEDGVARARP